MNTRRNCLTSLILILFPYLIIAMLFIDIHTVLASIIGFLTFNSTYKAFKNEKNEGTIISLIVCLFVTFIANLALDVNMWTAIIFTLIPSFWYYFVYTKIVKHS